MGIVQTGAVEVGEALSMHCAVQIAGDDERRLDPLGEVAEGAHLSPPRRVATALDGGHRDRADHLQLLPSDRDRRRGRAQFADVDHLDDARLHGAVERHGVGRVVIGVEGAVGVAVPTASGVERRPERWRGLDDDENVGPGPDELRGRRGELVVVDVDVGERDRGRGRVAHPAGRRLARGESAEHEHVVGAETGGDRGDRPGVHGKSDGETEPGEDERDRCRVLQQRDHGMPAHLGEPCGDEEERWPDQDGERARFGDGGQAHGTVTRRPGRSVPRRPGRTRTAQHERHGNLYTRPLR